MDQRLEKVQECTDGRKARHVCALKLTKRKLDLVVSQDFWYFQVKLLLEALKQLLLNMWGSFQQLLLAFQDADLTHQTFFVFVYELRAHLPQQRLFLVLRFGQWTAIWFHYFGQFGFSLLDFGNQIRQKLVNALRQDLRHFVHKRSST